MLKRGELLTTASSLEGLQYAYGFGADAVCLSGSRGGAPSVAVSYSEKELSWAVGLAHGLGKRLYLSLAQPVSSDELAVMPGAIYRAQNAGVDAVVLGQPGLLRMVRSYAPGLAVHLRLAAGDANSAGIYAALENGARRLLLPPELSLEEIAALRASAPRSLEFECLALGELRAEVPRWHLLHGQRSRAFTVKLASGEMISFEVAEDAAGSALVSTQDLCALTFLDHLLDAGVSSFRVEMDGLYPSCSATAAARLALNAAASTVTGAYRLPDAAAVELSRFEHRPWGPGFFPGELRFDKPEKAKEPAGRWRELGMVQKQEEGLLFCTLAGSYSLGQPLEALVPPGRVVPLAPDRLWTNDGAPVNSVAPPAGGFIIPAPEGLELPKGSFLRRSS